MISWLKSLFSSDKTVNSIVDKVSNGIDLLVYTDEEKAQDAIKIKEQLRIDVIRYMKATNGQNISRRILAFIVTVPFMTMVIAAAFGSTNISESALLVIQEIKPLAYLIFGFYFAAPHLDKFTDKLVSKNK